MWRQSHVKDCKYTWTASIIPPSSRLEKKQPAPYCLVVRLTSLAITPKHTLLHRSDTGTPLAHNSCWCNWLSYIIGWVWHKSFPVTDRTKKRNISTLSWTGGKTQQTRDPTGELFVWINTASWINRVISLCFIQCCLKLKIIFKKQEESLHIVTGSRRRRAEGKMGGDEGLRGLGTTSGPSSHESFMAAQPGLTKCASFGFV